MCKSNITNVKKVTKKHKLVQNNHNKSLINSKVVNSNTLSTKSLKSGNVWKFKIKKSSPVRFKNLPQNLLFILDNNSEALFLVDTGCEISILPKNLTNGINHYFRPQSKTIQGISNTPIHPIGSVDVVLKIGNLENIEHNFWVTQENRDYGIIGLDFLTTYQLSISIKNLKLYQHMTNRVVKLYTANKLPKSVVVTSHNLEVINNEFFSHFEEKCKNVLNEFPELTKTPDYTLPVKHGHSLEIIVENFSPNIVKARRCNGIRRRMVEENFDDLINRGAMSRGTADMCASPITIVPKKDNSIRVCVDYTVLNAHTRPMSYPLPRIDELAEIIPEGTKYFSCLDLKEAYHSLPIKPSSRKYAAIIAHHGVFIPHRTSFGLKNAPMAFQQMMQSVLANCFEYTFVYLDDILIFSKSEKDHLNHLREVFQTLYNNGLYLNMKKCVFAQHKLEFLGHSVGIDGVDVLEKKIEAIKNLPKPTNRKELKRFLGLCNYYNRHIPKLAEITAPLNEISGGPKSTNRRPLHLNEIQIKSYTDTLDILSKAATLAFEDHEKPLIVYSDASDSHVGAVLEQEGKNGEKRPLAFFSKKLPVLKTVRSTFFKELRALYLCLKHFQNRIIGRELFVRTDSLSVAKAINNPMGNQSPMEQRYIAAIKEYNPIVTHISGDENKVADALSRPPLVTAMYVKVPREDSDYIYTSEEDNEDSLSDYQSSESEEEIITPESLNKKEIANLQRNEPDLIQAAYEHKKDVRFIKPENLAVIVEDEQKRIILPFALRLSAYELAHGYLHLGKEKSVLATAKDYWWPTLRKDVEYYVQTCSTCQATRTTRHNRPKLGFYPKNIERFQFVHLDLVGPIEKHSGSFNYILTMRDRSTGFLATAPIVDKKAETVRDAFIQNWCGHYGIPQVIMTDNGREFSNMILTRTFEQLGIDHKFAPPYSPQTNGFVERVHNPINVALRALSDKSNWPLHLPLITISINNSFMEGSPFTPTQYAFGTCVNISGRVMLNEVSDNEPENDVFETKIFLNTMSKVSKVHKKYEERKVYYEPGLFKSEQVWLKRKCRKKLSSLYQGPYPVHSFSEHSAIIDKNSKLLKVSIRNIKAYFPREDLNEKGEKLGKNKTYNLRERRDKFNYAESSSDDET